MAPEDERAEERAVADIVDRLRGELAHALRTLLADRRRQGLELPEGEEDRLVRDLSERVHLHAYQAVLDGYGVDRYNEVVVQAPSGRSGERLRVRLDDPDWPSVRPGPLDAEVDAKEATTRRLRPARG